MPIDKPEATATATPRRTFLTRAAVGGALVTAGSIAGPLLRGLPAGAQAPAGPDDLDDPSYAALVTPFELAAVRVYAAALAVDGLSEEDADTLRLFQGHHETVASTTGALAGDDAEIVADPALIASASSLGGRGAALTALISLEESLAATHLWALAGIADPVTAKTAASILAVEGQHAVALTVMSDGDLAAATPGAVTTDASLSGGATPFTPTDESEGEGGDSTDDETTTTGEAGN